MSRLKSLHTRVVSGLSRAIEVTSPGGTGVHLTRYAMYEQLAEVVSRAKANEVDFLLSISHSRECAERIGMHWKDLQEANYPESTIFSIDAPDSRFDAVVSDQVMEHVEGDPADAFAETLRVLKPGGLLIHTTCFMMPVHGSPSDFWRFTPNALRLLLNGKAEVIEVGGWGNRAAVVALALGLRYLPVPHSVRHPIHKLATKNDPTWPILTWVVARKL